ncbi:MAG: GNAT family N-acetyltransferase [Burkholderiales bacterium]|nr:GNAT family N-acetyltransferase [Anaerolineae bacterium]
MVRLAIEADVRRMSLSLARAFDDDPVWRWLIPADGYADRMMSFGQGLLRHIALGYEATYTTDDCVSTAMWAPPGHWEASAEQAAALVPAFNTCFGANLEKFQEGFGLVGTKHPHEPHWYLIGIGTHPDWQGQGLASSVMKPILERCDTEGVPAYLEATKERNVRFYQHHGFELTGTMDFPGGGPKMYLMWREPQ